MLCWSLKNFVTDGMKDSGSFDTRRPLYKKID